MGADITIIAIVAGIAKRAVYLMADENMVLSTLCSFLESSFEKAGNSTVEMGNVKKLIKTEKLSATL